MLNLRQLSPYQNFLDLKNLLLKILNQIVLQPATIDEYSSLEYLIIKNFIRLEQLADLLTYLPQLRRLSLHSLRNHWKKCTTNGRLVLNDSTHVSLQLDNLNLNTSSN